MVENKERGDKGIRDEEATYRAWLVQSWLIGDYQFAAVKDAF
jgi:hypothetical protein